MSRIPPFALRAALPVFVTALSFLAHAQHATLQRVAVRPGTKDVEIEILASERIEPETLVVPSPDRLVIDFPGTMPGEQLRALVINRSGVKAVRAGLYRSSPPVTRIVLDLERPLPFQLYPSGTSVIVKVGDESAPKGKTAEESKVSDEPPAPPPPVVTVQFHDGLLSLLAERTNLAAVLNEIGKQTGADVAIPAGAEQEPVIAKLGPAPAREVLASLLNGSRYNFVMVGSNSDTSLQRVILTPKGAGGVTAPAPTSTVYNYTPPPVTPPTRVPAPQETMPPDQQVPEQSGDQAGDMPAPEQPAQQEGAPNDGTAPPQ